MPLHVEQDDVSFNIDLAHEVHLACVKRKVCLGYIPRSGEMDKEGAGRWNVIQVQFFDQGAPPHMTAIGLVETFHMVLAVGVADGGSPPLYSGHQSHPHYFPDAFSLSVAVI